MVDERSDILEGETIDLAELARLSAPEGIVSNKTFLRCQFIGPAVIVPLNSSFFGNRFQGDWEAIAWVIPAERKEVIGGIGFRNCVFENCSFTRIGLGASQELLERFLDPGSG